MTQDPNAALTRFNTIRSRYDTVERGADLSDLVREVSSLRDNLAKLPEEIRRMRERKYIFAAYLENKAEVLAKRWDEIRDEVSYAIRDSAERLHAEVEARRFRIQKATNASGNPTLLANILPEIESEINSLDRMYDSAKSRIRDMYSSVRQETDKTLEQVRKIHGYLDERDDAKFEFLAGENVYLVSPAEWVAGEKPDGNLYLTDQRLLFEQKEKTGKKLGIFGGKHTQELEWEIGLNQIESVEPENKGLFGGKDMLHFTLGAGAPYSKITVEVKGGVAAKFWAAQIQRMIRGETQDERAIQPDTEFLQAIKDAPTDCPTCGGTLPRLVASQNQINCQYCGMVIRVG